VLLAMRVGERELDAAVGSLDRFVLKDIFCEAHAKIMPGIVAKNTLYGRQTILSGLYQLHRILTIFGYKTGVLARGTSVLIMLGLKLGNMAESESAHAKVDADTGLLHGTKELKFLVMPRVRTGHIVSADSYFASVPAPAELKRPGSHFIGVAKTDASRMFSQDYLAIHELSNQGEKEGVYCKTDKKVMVHCSWHSFGLAEIVTIFFQQHYPLQMERHIAG
jgi:hypothetical protein